MRLRMTLVEGWEFAPDRSASGVIEPANPTAPANEWRAIRVPGYWQAQFPDLARATGPAWYRLSLDLTPEWFERDVLALEFGAVSHYCQGWLNGRYLGDHEGGHLPFSWTVTEAARSGSNELLVRVVSPSGDRSRFPDFPFEETLHGKQSWYGPAGGIWQDVHLEARSAISIETIDIRPDADTGEVTLRIELEDPDSHGELRVDIIGPDDVGITRDIVPPGQSTTVGLADHELQLWSPDSPSLYRLRVTALVDGHPIDELEKHFGFRTFVAEDGRFVLNGRPLFMRGVLDQDYWESPGVPDSKEAILDRFAAVKAMGFNTVRCHIKLPDPTYLDAADEIGLLLWCELPSTSRLTKPARRRIEELLTAMVERDRHHPSVVVWGIANEAWGYDLVGNAEHRAWLRELYWQMKVDVTDRLIVDNSPCLPNFHIETDVEDFHFYAVIPEMREQWDRFIADFAGRSDFTFSPHGDAERSGTEPLVVSEFGAWGLPDLSHLEADEPWWFESGQEWADGAAYVHGARERYSLWHLDAVFGSWEGLCHETQRRQFETMQYQINTMRARSEIAGYVLTELSDVHWEANGLLDMTGRPRSFEHRIDDLNRSPALIAFADRPAIQAGESATVDLTFVNGDDAKRSVEVRVGTSGDATDAAIAVGEVGAFEHRHLGAIEVAPSGGDAAPTLASVECRLVDDYGTLASAIHPVLALPRVEPPDDSHSPLVVGDQELAERLMAMGYDVSADHTRSDGLRVLRRLEADDHDFIEAGGRGLLLVDDVDALGEGFGEFPRVELKAWRDALFGGGEWVSAFSWLRRSGHFADLPGGPLMDSMFEGLTPDVVITGIPPARFEYDVHAGVFVGWVHQVAALIARHDAGLGSLMISTLKLVDQPLGARPLASWLLHQLIATARE